MLRLVSAALVVCWALCIFLNSFPAEQASKGRNTRPAPPAPKPRGLEWRKIGRLPAGRIVALRVQVILA